MLINNLLPGYALRDFVRFYRIIHFNFDGDPDRMHDIKAYRPRIEHCLQFTPFDNEQVRYNETQPVSCSTALFGQHTVLTNRKVGKTFLNFQVVFQPGALYILLKDSLQILTNIYAPASLFFNQVVTDVNEQLACCSSYPQMVIVVETALTSLFKKVKPGMHPVCAAAREMLHADDQKKIEWYARQCNLSIRQFSRMFTIQTGVAPADYRNLVRLDKAYLLKNRDPLKDGLSLAIESGFYDYQHLSKNYKKYYGSAPSAFYLLEQRSPERSFGYYEH